MVFQIIIAILTFFIVFFANVLIVVNNPVKSVLSLMSCLACVAIFWLLMGAEFLSMVLIFVYLGGVMTLFLFTVMMMNESSYSEGNVFSNRKITAVVFIGAVVPFSILFYVCYYGDFSFSFDFLIDDFWGFQSESINDFSLVLYQEYFWLLQIMALTLIIPIVLSVSLVRKGAQGFVKVQNSKEQLNVSASSRLSLIKNKGEKK